MSTSCSINSSSEIKEIGELLLSPERCTACMSCILACSLHHAKRFDKKIASIEVTNSKKEREIHIVIRRRKKGQRRACDFCEGENEPLCVKYCATKAIIYRGIIE